MNTFSIGSQSKITQAGTIARACLAPGQRGRVLAAFSQAIYLQSEMGELFWITTEEAPLHRRCAQISSSRPKLSAGSQYHMDGHDLIVDRAVVGNIEQVIEWHKPLMDQVVNPAALYSWTHTLFTYLDYSHARGFGTFIPSILSLGRGNPESFASEPDNPVLKYAKPYVMDMASACLGGHAAPISQFANSLIGLGEGLTPSGDDLLGGMFFTLRLLHQHYPDLRLPDFTCTINQYLTRTHFISYTLLQDLTHGHAIAPLHHIANGLLCGRSIDELYPYISQLSRVGHSTGWDLLTGLLVGLLATHKSHYSISSFKLKQTVSA
jgi:Protein of unknown function (DUF2877)